MAKEKGVKKQKEIKTAISKGVAVPLEWHVPDTIITRYASNIVVQTVENQFKIMFFETKPEIQLTPGPHPKSVKAECVACVIITPDKLVAFTDVLQRQIELHGLTNQLKDKN